MSFFAMAGLTIFILVLFAGIFLNLFGLPGTLVIFFDVLVYAIFTGFETIGWKILLILLIIAAFSEIIDFILDMSGGLKPMQVKKSLLAAVAGAFTGVIIFTALFGGPGIWTGFFLGGFAGILIIEFLRQSDLKKPFRATNRALFGMIGRKLAKGFVALFMIALSLSNIYS